MTKTGTKRQRAETKALDRFWRQIYRPLQKNERTSVRRLALLKKFAHVVVAEVSPEARAKQRLAFQRRKRNPKFVGAGSCWCCVQTVEDREEHHVIQIQHGGTNAVRNRVSICGGCHAQVHPWLRPEPLLDNALYRPVWS